MELGERAHVHAALGDPHRLRIVDALQLGDRTFQELAEVVGLPGNAAAHHLRVLEAAGVVERRASDGDHRRRYVSLRADRLGGLFSAPLPAPRLVLFVCTHNSARSQFAAALWRSRTGLAADSAGLAPADRVHPRAVRAASAFGIDLSAVVPKGYGAVEDDPDLVVSVCDVAREAGLPFAAPSVHWSMRDPVLVDTDAAFGSVFAALARRIDRLAGRRGEAGPTPLTVTGAQRGTYQ